MGVKVQLFLIKCTKKVILLNKTGNLLTKVNDYLPLNLSGSSAFDSNTDAYTFIYWDDLEWHNLKTEDQAWIKGWTQGILFARAVNTTLQYNGVEILTHAMPMCLTSVVIRFPTTA